MQSPLKSVQTYPATYAGKVTPFSTRSCQIVAGKLNDRYLLETKSLSRRQELENDYFGTIALEEEKGNLLLAFDQNWILPGLLNFDSEDISRDEQLRYTIAGQDYIKPKDRKITIADLSIYSFYDSSMLNDRGDLTEVLMIFASVSIDQAERMLLYLIRNVKLYSFTSYYVVKDLYPSIGLDLEYLFPLKLKYLNPNYVILSSTKLTTDQLESIYRTGEISFPYNRINDLQGAYATYLLAEATNYNFKLHWYRNSLKIGWAGYIQMRDLNEYFGNLLTDLNREEVRFIKLEDHQAAVKYCQETDAKCFYHNGLYYAAVTKKTSRKNVEVRGTQLSKKEVSLIELRGVLKRENGKYLQELGYEVTDNLHLNKIKLEFITYQNEADEIHTVYYYRATNDSSIVVKTVEGKNEKETYGKMQFLLNTGKFFTQKTKNLVTGYPGFVPSDPIVI